MDHGRPGDHGRSGDHAQHGGRQHGRLLLMAALSFAALYVLMCVSVNASSNVYHQVNQFYMAGLMAAPMVIFEVVLMQSTYPGRRRNAVILGARAVALVALLF